jgi:peptidoglycan/xylan/chitin deacetylase (PgdA/CDA1 family)
MRSSAVAALRAARGDAAGAVDRAAWAAHGAGAVLGPLLAESGLEPDRRSTSLRPAVPDKRDRWPRSRAWRPGRRATAHGAILLYHRVIDAASSGLAVAPARFAEQLEVLRACFVPAPLEALLAGEAGPAGVAITFDDGYHDNLLHALPALRAANVPATLFASTGHIATGEGFWWDEVAGLLEAADPAAGRLELTLPEGVRAWAPRDATERAAAAGHVRAALQTRDRETIARALVAIRRWAGRGGGPGAPPERDRPLTVDELRVFAAAGPFDVQAHGRTHVSLAHADPAVRDAELRGSADDLEAWLGRRPAMFAYPFGVTGVDVDAGTRAAARVAGYRWAATTSPGLARAGGPALALRRLAVGDLDGPAFERWLSAALPAR